MAPIECARARFATGLPRDMPPEQISAAMKQVTQYWWPQLCRTSRHPRISELNIFDPAWYGSDGQLDICNPAYFTILNVLGQAYSHVLKTYPDEDVKSFSVRWRIRQHLPGNVQEVVIFVWRMSGHREKGFCVKSPVSGWMDFSKEIKELRAKRDAEDNALTESGKDKTTDEKPAVDKATDDKATVDKVTDKKTTNPPATKPTDPLTLLATSRIAVPTDHGTLAHHPRKKRTITDQLKEALTDEPTLTVHAPKTAEPTSQVDEWDDYVIIGDDDYIKTSASNKAMLTSSSTNTASTVPAADEGKVVDEEVVDEWDDYVMVGEEKDSDEVVKHILPYRYKYEKKDAVKPVRKGWFGGWLGKKKGEKKEEKKDKKE